MSSWDTALLELHDTALVRIARERRLVLEGDQGPQKVDLCWVDEVALTLIDLADAKRQKLTIVYPAPAGQVAVLLAAQILLRLFVEGSRSSSIGVVTADATMAVRTWNALRIATTGDRPAIADVFPCYRAGPNGECPGDGTRIRGVVVGQVCKQWNVDHLIVDRLAGPIRVESDLPSIEVAADPTDPALRLAEASGRAIWGWSEAALADGGPFEHHIERSVPFSVATERIATIAGGVSVRLFVAHHPEAEAAIARAREDLRLLREMSSRGRDRNIERGLAIAWHHLTTLCSLPCQPSRFDGFGGRPPIAARPTRTFADELAAWAATLDDDRSEIAYILASDIADLRAALELGNPIEVMLHDLKHEESETMVVTRTRTAARALEDALDLPPAGDPARRLTVVHVGGLHRQGTWPRAVFVGEPSPWDWHRVLSGLAPGIDVFTLGKQSAHSCARAVGANRSSHDHWGGDEVRRNAWRSVVGGDSPTGLATTDPRRREPIIIVDGAEYAPEPDPFEPLSSLFDLVPLDIAGEGPALDVARESDTGEWSAAVAALAVVTDLGRMFLEDGKPVDVRDGQKIKERLPEKLEPGTVLLIGRREGRIGLVEALEEKLGDRPDLIASRYLIDDFRRLVRKRWAESGLTLAGLHRELVDLGCSRTLAAARSWITEGTMAPQQFEDLERLNAALGLGMTDTHLRELFAGVQRRRGFRRAAGRALAAAARDSTILADDSSLDDETGLSVADLREAVVEATVMSVTRCDQPIPLTLLGILEVS